MNLTDGIWSDTLKEDFLRSPTLGHLDLLDALAQGCMMLRQTGQWQHNPYTAKNIDQYTAWEAQEGKNRLTRQTKIGYSILKALGMLQRRRS
jgi:hypothetical protein